MRIYCNGKEHQTEAATVGELLEMLGFTKSTVAVAVNRSFVSRQILAKTPLREGDEVEIVAPMVGG